MITGLSYEQAWVSMLKLFLSILLGYCTAVSVPLKNIRPINLLRHIPTQTPIFAGGNGSSTKKFGFCDDNNLIFCELSIQKDKIKFRLNIRKNYLKAL